MPFTGHYSEDWKEEEIDREMVRMYRRQRSMMPPEEELSEGERLELKELKRLRQKWDWDEDFV